MAIDISHRKSNHINKIIISKKFGKGLSFLMLSAAALIMSAVGFTAYTFNLHTVISNLLSAIGFCAVPIISFLTAEVYTNSKSPRTVILLLAVTALISHVPYVLLNTGGLHIISHTSIIFSVFLGYMGLILQDMQGIDQTVKAATILLICLACMISDNGSITAVWILIFGSRHDITTKKKLFYTAGIILIIINLIYGIFDGCWYAGLYQLGFLLSVPFVRFYNSRKSNITKGKRIVLLYPLLILLFWLIKLI